MISALVPAKSLDTAKGRLASLLSEDERRKLALAMLEDVVRALQGAPDIDSVHVVSPDGGVLQRASDLGAATIDEPPSVRGINQALAYASETLEGEKPDVLVVVLADVPAITPADVESVIEALPPGKGVVISPSVAKGTSVLALRPPGVIPFRFGEGSFSAHKREAMARGLKAKVLRIESASHDIDEPEDLRHLMSVPAETATHALMAQLRIEERLA